MLRWAAIILGGFTVEGAEGLAPDPGQIDWRQGALDFLEKANLKGRLGVHVGMVIVMTAPLWLWGRFATAASLGPTERARLLSELLRHRVFLVRELALLLKLVACMTFFRDPAIRARSAYNRPKVKALLPVVREVA